MTVTVTRANAVIVDGTPIGCVRQGRRGKWWDFLPFDGIDLPADTARLKRLAVDRAVHRFRQLQKPQEILDEQRRAT